MSLPRSHSSRACAGLLVLSSLLSLSADLEAQNDRAARGRRQPPPVVAVKVGVAHTVAGDPIRDAVILLQGGTIRAVGAAADVEIPEGATIVDHGDAEAWPGLVDCLTDAFGRDAASSSDVDAATALEEGLDPYEKRPNELAPAGVTTAFVGNRSNKTWRGQGALIRPVAGGFASWPARRGQTAPGAVGLRMTTGTGNDHPLDRVDKLARIGREFDALEAYEKSWKDFETKKKAYDEAFEKYIAWHEARKKTDEPAEKTGGTGGESEAGSEGDKPAANKEEATENPPAETGEAGGESGGENRGRRPREGRRRGGSGGPGRRPAGARPQGGGSGDSNDAAAGNDAPKRPEHPKQPRRDAEKDALIRVRDGDLALRIEARRPGEVHAALALARERELPRVVIEHATAVDDAAVVKEIANAGIAVVVTDVATRAEDPWLGGEPFDATLAADLAAAGVPIAIASTTAERSRYLPLLAAQAVAAGLSPNDALRAITLTPAEILGIQRNVGSLEAGKWADILITSGSLFDSETRVLRVMSRGRTVYESEN